MAINWLEVDGIGTLALAIATILAVFIPQLRYLITKPRIVVTCHAKEVDVKRYIPTLQQIDSEQSFKAYLLFFDVENKGKFKKLIQSCTFNLKINEISANLNVIEDDNYQLTSFEEDNPKTEKNILGYNEGAYLTRKTFSWSQMSWIYPNSHVSFLAFRTTENQKTIRIDLQVPNIITKEIGDSFEITIKVETRDISNINFSTIVKHFNVKYSTWNSVNIVQIKR